MEAKKIDGLSFEEYLLIEQDTNTKHEYHDGTIFAMAGGSVEHGLIASNMLVELGIRFRNSGENCRPLNSDIKLKILALNKYVYPDGMVICGDIEREEDSSQAVTNPKVIIEVLFKSTEAYDRGDKFFFYKQIPSLQDYILLDQHHALIDIYSRKDKLWQIQRIEGLKQNLQVPSLDLRIPLSAIYQDVL